MHGFSKLSVLASLGLRSWFQGFSQTVFILRSLNTNICDKNLKNICIFEVLVSKHLFFQGFQGPQGFRKVREAGREKILPIFSKSDLMVPSYDKKTKEVND